MKINKAYKYRLKPNKEQKIMFEKNVGCCRFVYNYFLDLNKKYYEEHKKFIFKHDMQKILSADVKKEYPFLKEVKHQSLQKAIWNLDNALKNFFRKNSRFPTFKKKGISDSFHCPQYFEVDQEIGKIKISKIGWVKYINSRPIEGIIKSITVSKNCSHWYASILTEQEIEEKPKTYNNPIGVDVGIKNFAFLSDGNVITNPQIYRKYEEKLAVENRRLASKIKGSANWKRQVRKVQKIYSKIYNFRKDFLHKKSKEIIDGYDLIGVEDLNVKGLIKNRHLSKSIADASWGTFVNYLEYESLWNSRTLQKVDRFYPSSQLCSACGGKKIMPLHLRTYVCEECGAISDRDFNASKNIEKRAIELAFENLSLPSGRRDVKPVEKVGCEICEAGTFP